MYKVIIMWTSGEADTWENASLEDVKKLVKTHIDIVNVAYIHVERRQEGKLIGQKFFEARGYEIFIDSL